MARNSMDRIVSCSRWLALFICLLIVPLSTHAAQRGPLVPSSGAKVDALFAVDTDGDGVPIPQDCNDADPGVHPAYTPPVGPPIVAATEFCDGHDNDCNGLADEGPGYTVPGTPCTAGTGACLGNRDSLGNPAQYVCTSLTTSACNAVPQPNGTACNDSDQCTGPDFCTGGTCGGPTLITVSPNNLNGWAFRNDNDDQPGTGTMVAGPGTPPLNLGSVHLPLSSAAGPPPPVNTGNIPADRQLVATSAYGGTKIVDITRLEYSTYRASVDAGNNLAIALQFDVDYDGADATYNYQGRLVFEPYQGVGGNVPQNTWQTWTPLTAGKWWGSSGNPRVGNAIVAQQCPQGSPCTWAQVQAFYPLARVHASIGSPAGPPGQFLLKSGGPAPGFDGYADRLIVGVLGVQKTYDFEAADPCTDYKECTVDTCSANICLHANLPAATACSDSAFCTVGDACDGSGNCVAGAARDCTPGPVVAVGFEPAAYAIGNINGQAGWSKTGAFDVAVVANTYGYPSFGTQSLRISDAVTSGSFGDQAFSQPLANEVGETTADNGGMSGGTRKTHFEAEWDLASTLPTLQAGMHFSASADRGDGSRMTYLRFEDSAAGIDVFFDDFQDVANPSFGTAGDEYPGCLSQCVLGSNPGTPCLSNAQCLGGGTCDGGDNFYETLIATISRTPHQIRLTLDTLEGPKNDVVKVYIDGVLVHTGTSWEDYFRWCAESNPGYLNDRSRTVDSMLFRVSGGANPANVGNGFLIDNFRLQSGVGDQCNTSVCTEATDTCDPTPANELGPCGDPDTTECNAADRCESGVCVDKKDPSLTPCTADTNPCTLDQCNGTSNACQHPAGNSGTVCRADVGQCDIEETCDGSNTTCPADVFEPSTTTCVGTSTGGACDDVDKCAGANVSSACVDKFKAAGTACTDGDKCTGPDYCPGGSATCGGPTYLTVSSNNLNGWSFWDDTTDTPTGTGTFVAGPAPTPLGTGSVRLALSTATDRQIIGTFAHGGTRLADITRLAYSTYRSSLDAGNNLALTLQFDVDYDLNDNSPWAPAGGNPTGRRYQGRLVFEPNISNGGGTIPQNTWQTWDVTAGKWWSSGGPGAAVCTQGSPCTTAQLISSWPNVGIHANIAVGTCVNGCGVPGRLLVKAGGPGPAGFDGNADAVIIEVGGASPSRTTYDFENTDPCSDVNDCTIDTCVPGGIGSCVSTNRPDSTTVAPGNLNGWAAISRRTAGGVFIAGPPTPPLGAGSYLMATGPGGGGPALPGGDSAGLGGKTWLGTEQFNGTLLSAITAMGYSTFIQASPGGNTIVPAINMYVDLDGNGTRDTTLVFEPVYTYGNPTPGVWQTWSASGSAKWWYTANFGALNNAFNDFQPLSYYVAQFPNAKIVSWYSTGNPVRSDGWGLNLVAGQNSAGPPWNDFVGNVDNFTFATGAGGYTADMEPTGLCNDSNACTQDQCGSGACVNPNSNAGTACGDNTATTCNGADTCNGAGACGANFALNTVVCRASAGACDLAELCDGAGGCPGVDAKSTAVCRASLGVCDLTETCDGIGNNCPSDAKSTAECRADTGQCDVAENCDGSSNTCPADAFELSTVLCTGASQAGFCDNNAADHCLGTADTCVDVYKSAATVCRADTGQCDIAENCTGSSGACPADAFELSGTACNDGLFCTVSDVCDGANGCGTTPTARDCNVGLSGVLSIGFEPAEAPPWYTIANINGQDGWSKTGAYDAAVVANTYGYPTFGTQSLRISNAVTSGSFGDHTFSKSLPNEVGETTATNGGLSGGTRKTHFEAEWDFASTVPGSEQTGLSVVSSPDRGDGARMSWVQMQDTPTGLQVNFFDYQDVAPFGSVGSEAAGCSTSGGDAFQFTAVATGLDRTVPHTIKITMDTLEGPRNDVVKVYVDGVLLHTGTSWEDYFRWCETTDVSRTVDSILFRTGGTAFPANAGNGFLIDNLRLQSGVGDQCNVSTCNEGTDTCDPTPTNQGGACGDQDNTDCNAPNTCDAGACVDNKKLNSFVCRASQGQCDVQELCTGTSNACPSDAKSSAVCRPSAGVCDVADSCDGVGNACPSDAKSTTVCRPSAGACDLADSCDGTNNACPADAKSTAVCRASQGVCDLADSCDGTNDACPADAKSTAVCRAAAGDCDVADSCDGTNNACPADAKVPAATQCRAAAGDCDAAEFCDGTTSICPPDAKLMALQSFFDVFFEVPLYSPGSIQGQTGWSGGTIPISASVDQAVDQSGSNSRTGSGAWRVSNKAYNGNFNGWPFSPGLPVTAGQPSSGADGDQFNATFYFKAANTVADGSSMEIDLGTSTGDDRNTFLAVRNDLDSNGGLKLRMAESDATLPAVPDDFFWPTLVVATNLNRTTWHRIDIVAKFYDGNNNDKFQVFLDGVAMINTRTGGTTWGTFEGYRNGLGSPYAKSNRLFWRSGASASDINPVFPDAGAQGFWFDDVSYSVSNQASYTCRAATGVCDVAEVCDGTSNNCPSDAVKPNTEVCRGSAGICDVVENCDGTNKPCPNDVLVTVGTTCRASGGECDLVEECTGASPLCPGDAKKGSGTACTADLLTCSLDQCNGTDNACQHPAGNLGTECRGTAGDCDVAESCDGASVNCPANGFKLAAVVCRGAAGTCDVAENCTGSSAACPADSLQPSTTECRTAVNNTIIYDSIAGAAEQFSEGYDCCQIAELGDHIQFAPATTRILSTVTVRMTQFPYTGGPYTHPLTLNLYSAVNPDTVIATRTVNVTIPAVPGPAKHFFSVDFDFSGVVIPDTLYYGLTFQNSAPTNGGLPVGGGYDSLNFTVRNVSTPFGTPDGPVPVGTDLEGNIVYSRHRMTPLDPFQDDAIPSGDNNDLDKGFTPSIRFNTGCDVPEYCTGSNVLCPSDGFVAGGTTCRASVGECDLADACTGSSSVCAADAKKGSGVACTADSNVCTLDQCNGTDDACQHPAGNAGTVCRATAGICDVAEQCDGASVSCPSDAKSTAECRASGGVCDPAESCDGTNNACPSDAKSTAVCRPSAGVCDLADSCDGTNNACPSDAKSTAVCRPVAGYCDLADSCDGVGNACPSDVLKAATVVCRPATEICDVAENCTGSSALCPATDAVATTSVVCRPAAGGCDLADNCDGTNKTCPADATSTAVCRPAAGTPFCDVAESCTGASGTTIYDSVPGYAGGAYPPLPYNLPSLGYEATSTSELGDYITFAGTDRYVTDVTVTMSTWARYSEYPAMSPSGWTHPLTLKLYDLGPANSLGAPIAGGTVTASMSIPWRPEGDPTCPTGDYGPGFAWRAADGQCYNGLAFDITFHVNLDLGARSQVIFGIEYSTGDYGPVHLGPGPWNSLNVGLRYYLNSIPGYAPGLDSLTLPVGVDTNNDSLFWNTTVVPWYTEPCPGGTFCRDTLWFPFTPAIRFNAVPAASVTCPADAFQPSNVACTGAANGASCDLDSADHCSGSANTCVDAFRPNTYECRADAGQCDVPENCTGSASACPPNGFEPSGAACTDNNVCTSKNASPATADECNGSGGCNGTAVICISDGDACTADVCHGPTTGCTNDPVCGIAGTVVYNKITALTGGSDVALGDPLNPIGDAKLTLTGGATGFTLSSNGPVPAAGTYSFSNVAGNITDTPTRLATANDVLAGLDSSDPSLISKRSVGLVGAFTPRQFKAGDVSVNGVITAFDAALVSQRAVGILPVAPVVAPWTAPSTLGTTMWFFDPISKAFTPAVAPVLPAFSNVADFVGVLYGDVSMTWLGPDNPFAGTQSNLPAKWQSLDPAQIQRIVRAPNVTSEVYVSQAPLLMPDGSYEMVLGMTQAEGILGLDLTLSYDPAIVTIESLSSVSLSALFAIDTNIASAGVDSVSMYSPAPMEGTGDFLVVKMRFNGAYGGLPIEIIGNANEGAVNLRGLSVSDPESPTPGGPVQQGQNGE